MSAQDGLERLGVVRHLRHRCRARRRERELGAPPELGDEELLRFVYDPGVDALALVDAVHDDEEFRRRSVGPAAGGYESDREDCFEHVFAGGHAKSDTTSANSLTHKDKVSYACPRS